MKIIPKRIKKLRYLFYFFSLSLYASGGYDNGTSIGKGSIGLDLTWNPFNYWEKGQSYAVVSYGITQNLDIHGYYSIQTKGNDNFYLGIFYQFIRINYLDLATAIGIRNYNPKFERHLFFPQLLYTINLTKKLKIGGSFVRIVNINNNYKTLGTTQDISLVIPIYRYKELNKKISSIDLAIGFFRPILWKPKSGSWHPTYSIDIKFLL